MQYDVSITNLLDMRQRWSERLREGAWMCGWNAVESRYDVESLSREWVRIRQEQSTEVARRCKVPTSGFYSGRTSLTLSTSVVHCLVSWHRSSGSMFWLSLGSASDVVATHGRSPPLLEHSLLVPLFIIRDWAFTIHENH